MAYDLNEGAVDTDEPRWLILQQGRTPDGKPDPSQDAGFLVRSEMSPRGLEVTREATEVFGLAISKGGEAARQATQQMLAFKAAKLVEGVKNITADGRELTADFDDLYSVLQQKKYVVHRGMILLFARDDNNWRPLSEAESGN